MASLLNPQIGTITETNRDIVDRVEYQRNDITELDLAYAITIHKSQGSEFGAVIIPVLSQHFKMLFRNLVYTGLTRAKKLAVLWPVGRAMFLLCQRTGTTAVKKSLNRIRIQNHLSCLCENVGLTGSISGAMAVGNH
jgi:ATP-dependent exoDNAse (exonuclease V) alpha subunit